jgi:hypothetical protein
MKNTRKHRIKGCTAIGEIKSQVKKIVERIVTPWGIKVNGLLYNDEYLAASMRTSNRKRMMIRFDPQDLSTIDVYDDFKGAFMPVAAVNTPYATGLSLQQHKANLQSDKAALARAKEEIRKIVADKCRQRKVGK